jgi:undecaprenyl-diphosphatase
MPSLESLNRSLFLQINGGADTPVWLLHIAVGVADDLIYAIPLLLLGFWLWGGRTRRSLAIKACLVALLGVAANQVIGHVWPHPRPFMIGLGHAWIRHAPDSSFPSDHLTVFAGVGVTLLFGGAAEWAAVALLVGLCVAWARVFLGVHFPLDMVGAFGVAILAYAGITPVWHKAGAPLTNAAERLYQRLLAYPIAAGWLRT